jgi:hypothetical protein
MKYFAFAANSMSQIHQTPSSVKRTGLTAKRQWLFEQFEVTPTNIRLGHESKGLDDQISECTEHMRLALIGRWAVS